MIKFTLDDDYELKWIYTLKIPSLLSTIIIQRLPKNKETVKGLANLLSIY